jgi:acyl-CoA synthetase (AMP-forming)/AMP-acid ligase II
MSWLGHIPRMREERHYGGRLVTCFAERPGSVPAMLAEAELRNPRGEAVVDGERRLDWASLAALVARTAGGLKRLGVATGDRVALLMPNRLEFVISLHAVLRLGAIAVPLNIREERPELAYILANCGAKAAIYAPELAAKLPLRDESPSLALRIALERADGASLVFDGLTSADPVPAKDIAEEQVAAILYTSGTTGRPKGAMLTHFSLVHAALIYEACMGLGAADRSVVTVPLSHVTGLTAALAAMLRVAGTLIIAPPFKAETFLALAARERMTHTVMVPAMYSLCLMSPSFAAVNLSRWRIGGYGGAPMPEAAIRALAERLPGLKLMNAYGSTETTGPVVLMPPAQSLARRHAVGRAVPVADVRIMDDDGREVPAGEAGEIWLKAPNVVPGYWQNEAATAESFVAGYWRSGDIGAKDQDGYLTLLDRKKDMINRGGFKIYSVEVENVLAAHPAIAEAAVVGRPCPVLGERVHAVLVPKPGVAAPDGADLADYCRGKLADYKVPETFAFLAEPLPRNANGKVLKRQLREMAVKG